MNETHELILSVRDYECDLQGVVNNSVYMNYLEHARHEFLKSQGINFAELTAQGIHLILIKAEMEYKASLTPGDNFTVTTYFEQESRLKIVFHQTIHRSPDLQLMLTAKMTAAALNKRGRPFAPQSILDKLI